MLVTFTLTEPHIAIEGRIERSHCLPANERLMRNALTENGRPIKRSIKIIFIFGLQSTYNMNECHKHVWLLIFNYSGAPEMQKIIFPSSFCEKRRIIESFFIVRTLRSNWTSFFSNCVCERSKSMPNALLFRFHFSCSSVLSYIHFFSYERVNRKL